MAGSRMNKRLFIIAFIALLLLSVTFYGWFRMLILTFSYDIRLHPAADIMRFSPFAPHESVWYQRECFGGTADQMAISTLEDVSGKWATAQHPDCISMFEKFVSIYSISRRSGQIVIPETFQTKVLKWLGNDEELLKEAKLQFITSVFNHYTHEETVVNLLRSKRPGVQNDVKEMEQYIEDLLTQSKDCDFCDYKFKTAEDTFGRIESEHAVTAANAFKYDAYHAVILLKTHHPLRFSEEQFLDMFHVTMKWFMQVYATDRQYRYPHIMWDSLPKASASQIHPHAQASLSARSHYGLMEHIRLSALEYGAQHDGSNYFTDLFQIHNALGLTTSLGDAVAMAYLTPKKDYEIMIISRTGGQDFVRLLYYTIRAFIDDLQLYAWSLAVFLPKLEPYSTPSSTDIPAVARIISRGPPTSTRSDISAMELFAASNVNVDPFRLIGHVSQSVRAKGRLQAGDLKKIAERKERLMQEMDELEKQEEQLEQQETLEHDGKDPREAGDEEGEGDGGEGVDRPETGVEGGGGLEQEQGERGSQDGAVNPNPRVAKSADQYKPLAKPADQYMPLAKPAEQNMPLAKPADHDTVSQLTEGDGGVHPDTRRQEEDGDVKDVLGRVMRKGWEEKQERRDTMKRIGWPGKGGGAVEGNVDNT